MPCSQWVVENYRPFSVVDGAGFKKVMQSILDIGTRYGNNLKISDMLPDLTTNM